MSLALYRTYRPSRLSEVIGQEHVTEPLRRSLLSGNLHHAFLFSGPRGCGKTSTARILARSLICEQGPTPDPCGECDFCVALAPNGSGLVDVIELDAASHGGVDDTRELRERAAFVPAQARYKVYIVDEAHMVTKDGFNALLKLIEEPPEHLKFIFATTEVDKVLPTIRSRTFNYAFRLVPSRQLQQNLAGICNSEGVPFDQGSLSLISRASGGSVRDAQSIMGQLIAGADSDGLIQSEVGEQLGVTDEALLGEVVNAVAARDGAQVFSAVTRVVESGHDVRRFVTDLLHQFRDLLLITHIGASANEDVLDVTSDRLEVLRGQASLFGPAELTRLAEVINDGLTHVKGSTSPRLQLEVLVARLLIPSSDTEPESLLARIEVLERRLSAVASAAERSAAHAPPPELADQEASAGSAHARSASTLGPPSATQPAGNARQLAPTAADPTGAAPPVASDPTGAAPNTGTPATPEASAPTASAPQTQSHQPASSPAPSRSQSGGPPKRPAMSSLKQAWAEEGTPTTPSANTPSQTSERRPSDRTDNRQPRPGSAAHQGQRPVSPPVPQPGQQSAAPPAYQGRDSGTTPPVNEAEALDKVRSIWPELLAHIREQSRVSAASWEGAEPVRVENGVLTITLPTPGQEVSIRSSRRDLAMHTLLIEHFNIDLQVSATATKVEQANSEPDIPSADDPDLGTSELSGIDLAMKELGATQIGEIEGT